MLGVLVAERGNLRQQWRRIRFEKKKKGALGLKKEKGAIWVRTGIPMGSVLHGKSLDTYTHGCRLCKVGQREEEGQKKAGKEMTRRRQCHTERDGHGRGPKRFVKGVLRLQ